MSLDPTLSKSFLAFPQLQEPFVNPDGTLATAWYRLLIGMYKRLGGSGLAQPNAAYIAQAPTGAGAPLAVYSSFDNSLIGILYLQNTGGGPVQIIDLSSGSPVVFQALEDGTLFCFTGKLEVSRDSGLNWSLVGLTGGAVPLLKGDEARISWTTSPPQAAYFPIRYS